MILDCKNCKKKLTFIEDDISLEGQLITCKYCNEDWIYNSMTLYLENKLIELDLDLNTKEIKINELNTKHNEKIQQLEKDLNLKKEELNTQKLLEERISLFEKRVTDTEKLNIVQANLEIQIAQMENEVKKTSENISNKNETIEKKTNYLKMKINPYKNEPQDNESIRVNDKNTGVVNFKAYEKDEKKTKKRSFFWRSNKID
jgi:hypothetical protein